MASTIAAVTTGGGGVVTTADASGNLNLLAGTTTVVALTAAGATITGTLSATGDISAASVSGTAVATQANQETATSTTTVVTPGRQQYHPSAAKGWVKCQMDGISAGSYNVTSLTDPGTGQVTVTWGIDFSSTNYCAIGCAVFDPTGASAGVRWTQVFNSGYGASTTTVWCGDGGYGGADPNYMNVIAFGDQ